MLKLHGFAASNYYNMVKCVLLEKEADFETALVYPNRDPEFARISPMGKVPVLETEHGTLTETSVIMEYLDETLAGPRFYPSEPFARARVRELVKMTELYIELPARRGYPQAFFGGQVSDETLKQSESALRRGVVALRHNARFAPYLAGDELTAADIMFLFSFDLAAGTARKLFDLDLFEELPEASALFDRLKTRDSVKTVKADRDAAMSEFQKYVAKRAGG